MAKQEECFINYPHSDIVLGDLDIESRKHFVVEQKQLAEWLIELKESREQISNLKSDNERLRDCVDSCLRNSELDYIELAEAKRLLKLAVDDIHELLCDREDVSHGKGQICNICSYIELCNCCQRCTIRKDLRNWRYSDEVEKLLNNSTEICE